MSTDDLAHLFRIEWLPGDDHLVGTCFCGAQQADDEPKPLWAWLFAHPVGHVPHLVESRPGESAPGQPVPAQPVPAQPDGAAVHV